MDSRQLQMHKDAAAGNRQVGKIYGSRCDDNPNYFRTIRIARNPFTGNIQPQISNLTAGSPQPDMEELPPLLKHRLMRMNHALPY